MSSVTVLTILTVQFDASHHIMRSYIHMLTMSHDSPKDIALTRRQVEIVGNAVPFATLTRTLGEACRTTNKSQPA